MSFLGFRLMARSCPMPDFGQDFYTDSHLIKSIMTFDNPSPGDLIEVKTKDRSFKGNYVPQEGDAIFLKLASGYNIGIDKKRIESISMIEKHEKKQEKETPAVEQKDDLPKISILHTGGTIASKVDYATGGVVARFTPEELIEMFPEIQGIAKISSRLISNMWSEDMRFSHYNTIAEEIAKEIAAGATGVIVTQGTDTLHYTAAALSFVLDQLPIPVLIVGAQRSSDRGSSDAAVNVITAVSFMTQSDFSEVAVCMHKSMDDDTCYILPGTRCRKMHTSRRDTFKPIGVMPFAEVDFTSKNIKFFRTDYKKRSDDKLNIMPFKEDVKTALLKVHTNMHAFQFEMFKGFDGLVIEGTGLGQAPVNVIDDKTEEHGKIFDALKSLNNGGTVLAMAPQTIYGRISMNVYAPARRLKDECGIIGDGCDMPPETAFIKLSWLLSNYSKDEARELYAKDLRGELTNRTEPE
ncbi:Glu-tRNA(Gln) amidotransferase GatDE subunit D [Candidatus Woesearchaeota archaeon CG11_big_fil_rev_8_21_14_0_20_43_8]|nr:MAG: Glu-tRNA(Gln) amidotransferase GatDE subunit D [Candidatus Woesearchaeota archaeon CG11_big_fil_rev_8_21_14_0_20_43_8]PIO04940.1 MAG: Glu-tRNA(Gln) amidotransferase GatDE subunit D [Candidatus Woesearchaeota archaeon CG08_land_8_20_14_0_20_43_7]